MTTEELEVACEAMTECQTKAGQILDTLDSDGYSPQLMGAIRMMNQVRQGVLNNGALYNQPQAGVHSLGTSY